MVRLSGWVLALAVAGCARYPISEPLRKEARRDITFNMVQENPRAYQGSLVIWGGEVIRTENTSTGTMLYVLDTPLAGRERPTRPSYAQGRFIAQSARFLDPAVYPPGERVTIAGTVEGARTEKLGQSEYRYPIVHVDQIAVWKREVVANDYGPDYWGWYGPGCDWSWDWDCDWDWDEGWGWPGPGPVTWNLEWNWYRAF